jgi:hypothetical protein
VDLFGEELRPAWAGLLHERAEQNYGSDAGATAALGKQSLALYEALGDEPGIARSLFLLGVNAFWGAHFDEAERYFMSHQRPSIRRVAKTTRNWVIGETCWKPQGLF